MPHKPHKCAFDGCTNMVARKEALHCRKHAIKTPEHVAKIAAANRGKKLSEETRRKISIARSTDRPMNRVCEHCKRPFTVEKPSQKHRFCSRSCGYAHRRGENAKGWRSDMPHTTCRVCGKEFRLPAKTTQGKRFCCSYTCKNVWQKTHQPNKATNIERIMEAAIKARGWRYVSQYGLCNIAVADFYLLDTCTAIFCDGDYWHSLPGKAERDQRQTEVLQTNGYTVFRFLGSAIMADVDACLDAIEHSLPACTSGR